MGKHIQKTSVLVCTLSTQREGITVLHTLHGQLYIAQPLILLQEFTWYELF